MLLPEITQAGDGESTNVVPQIVKRQATCISLFASIFDLCDRGHLRLFYSRGKEANSRAEGDVESRTQFWDFLWLRKLVFGAKHLYSQLSVDTSVFVISPIMAGTDSCHKQTSVVSWA